ncbi:MAG: SPOR domain-containing protein [Bacteroidales bacterium]|nr:SPOR domain-containing protein [Bacteroidales bacterium]MBN2821445.1 SPOR domain-containing protein [Bacteroidales bacterium]
MKLVGIILTLFFFSSLPVLGQVKNIIEEVESVKKDEGHVKIIQDENISKLIERYQWAQSKQNGILGYRIRIFSQSGPNASSEFEQTKARFTSSYDDVEIHQSFDYPFYKIYVGDFRTRSDAMKVLVRIEKQFPDAFIVQTKINYPKLKFNE